MTERMIAAVEHPWLDAIGHPTGRKIETRPPYAIDMTAVIAAAAKNGTMIEINAAPDRRDMNESHARAAAEAGVLVLVDSDAHSARNFDLLQYGIATARRAWLTPEQVANTRSWKDFAPLRKRARDEVGRRPALFGRGAVANRARSTPGRLSLADRPPSALAVCREKPRQQLLGDDPVDRGGRERLERGRGALGVVGLGDVEGRADREPRADEPVVEAARDRRRDVRPGRGRGDEHAAVGERLELRDPVVLAPRGGEEDAERGAAARGTRRARSGRRTAPCRRPWRAGGRRAPPASGGAAPRRSSAAAGAGRRRASCAAASARAPPSSRARATARPRARPAPRRRAPHPRATRAPTPRARGPGPSCPGWRRR